MGNFVQPLMYALFLSAFTGLVSSGVAAAGHIPDCGQTGFTLGGCGDTLRAVVQSMVIGTIPSAPDEVNVFFGILGIGLRLSFTYRAIRLVRGGG